jgi:hypothetical protein
MQPFDNSPRISIDQEEEENAGLLKSYHSSQGEDYPPPASPDTPGVPFNKPSTIGFRFFNFQRPFLALSICLFFGVFLAASTFNHYSPIYDSLSTQGNEGLIRQKMHELPRAELDETKIRIQEATSDYTVTAVVLHGLGQPNHEPPFVRKLAEHFPYVRWLVSISFLFFANPGITAEPLSSQGIPYRGSIERHSEGFRTHFCLVQHRVSLLLPFSPLSSFAKLTDSVIALLAVERSTIYPKERTSTSLYTRNDN